MSISRDALAMIRPPTGAPAKAWVDRITACWRASVEAILEVGSLIGAAKESLPHGEFSAMVENDLPFGLRTAEMLMAIASDPRLTNPKRVSLLPPSWGTLYELHKLDDEVLERQFEEGLIRPDVERKEVVNGARAIMAGRHEPDGSLDYFPTPPWATRALMKHVLPVAWGGSPHGYTAWEPACGEGHIAEVLKEYFREIWASDIHSYGYPSTACDFLEHTDGDHMKGVADWIITNPPFGDLALQFVHRAIDLATVGVAMFFRSQWAVEGIERYDSIFRDNPPTLCAFFVERVPLCKGEWNPYGTTATAYCWLIWVKGADPKPPFWIPHGCRESLTKPDDIARFAPQYLDAEISESQPDPETGEIAA